MKKLTKNEIEDLIVGATILGVGGGGSPDEGLRSLMKVAESGSDLILASIEEFQKDDLVASPYFVGSVAPSEPKSERPKVFQDPVAQAVKLLQDRLGKKIAGTVATEIGGGNTAASLAIAGKLGIPMLDGDLMGRAGPELHQSTVHIFGFPMSPASIVSETGNQFVVDSYASIDDYEAIARYSSVISGGHVAVVDTPLEIPKARRCVIQGTISKCIQLGETRRKAVAERELDPVRAIAEKLSHGKIIFSGKVSEYKWKDERGFLFGEARVRGERAWEGQELKSYIMNEHIFCWINENPRVMPPDLIIFLDPETGLGITNDKLAEGISVTVVGAGIDQVWRSPRGLEFFGPKRFGLDYDYVPFEKLEV